ncbi:MAG: penicillin-binding protein 2 [Patescibacteria group bacterium]|jgi:penicillin-binding protein 2
MGDPFRWHADGEGLHVDPQTHGMVMHEVMYEEDFTHIRDHPLYMGASIPDIRFRLVFSVMAVLLVTLFGRAFWMQVVHGATFREQAERNRLRQEILLPRRGIVRDREGRVLAENTPSFDVRMTERLLPTDMGLREDVLADVGRAISVPVQDIEALMTSSTDPDESLVIKRDLSYERAIAVKILATDVSGIDIVVGSKRRYPESDDTNTLSHILGYVSGITREELEKRRTEGYRQIDLIGKAGVESTYESILRGTPGEKLYEVDSRHRITAIVGEQVPVDGRDLTLSIDLDLQRATEKALREGMEKAKVMRGSAIVMDPRDGSILAIASLPAYDDNFFSGTVSSTQYAALIANPDHPLLPRAWAGTYPSGSTAKPVISVAALAEGIITPQTTVFSSGGLHVGPWFFPDWKAGGHGTVTVRSALAWSVNTFYYYVGGGYDRFVGLGVDKLTEWMRKFGLGAKTGIDVPGEASGFVPSREWKEATKGERWYIGDTYNLSIGQGDLLVTPLQVASFTSTIANGGYVVTPRIGMRYGRPDESPSDVPITRSSDRIASVEAVETVRQGMRENVTYGSGRALSDLPFTSAGKTGTAQWRSDKDNHAWFTSFAPFEDPRVVVTVLLEEGKEGSSTAVPVAKEILRAWGSLDIK